MVWVMVQFGIRVRVMVWVMIGIRVMFGVGRA